jgi:hypothetical protein
MGGKLFPERIYEEIELPETKEFLEEAKEIVQKFGTPAGIGSDKCLKPLPCRECPYFPGCLKMYLIVRYIQLREEGLNLPQLGKRFLEIDGKLCELREKIFRAQTEEELQLLAITLYSIENSITVNIH